MFLRRAPPGKAAGDKNNPDNNGKKERGAEPLFCCICDEGSEFSHQNRLLEVPQQKVLGEPEELPEHVVGEVDRIRRSRDGGDVPEALFAGEGQGPGDVEVVGDKGAGGVRRGHELHAEADVLDGVAGPVFNDDAGGVDPLFYEIPLHAFALREGLAFPFAAGHDAEGITVLAHIIRRRVEAVLEDGAGTVFADLGAKNDQVVQVCRRPAPEARQNDSLADEKEKNSCRRGCEKKDPRRFGQVVPDMNARSQAQEKKAGSKSEPDGVKHCAAADQQYGYSVENAQYSDNYE